MTTTRTDKTMQDLVDEILRVLELDWRKLPAGAYGKVMAAIAEEFDVDIVESED